MVRPHAVLPLLSAVILFSVPALPPIRSHSPATLFSPAPLPSALVVFFHCSLPHTSQSSSLLPCCQIPEMPSAARAPSGRRRAVPFGSLVGASFFYLSSTTLPDLFSVRAFVHCFLLYSLISLTSLCTLFMDHFSHLLSLFCMHADGTSSMAGRQSAGCVLGCDLSYVHALHASCARTLPNAFLLLYGLSCWLAAVGHMAALNILCCFGMIA